MDNYLTPEKDGSLVHQSRQPATAKREKEYGSFFPALEGVCLATEPCSLPWEERSPLEYFYVETGRQALRLIVNELVQAGISRVYLPSYLCDSMLQPFSGLFRSIEYIPTDSNFQLNLGALKSALQLRSDERCAVLLLRYFGRSRDSSYLAAMSDLQYHGHVVIEDLTHSLFDSNPSVADYTMASLRKLLPVATGAFVTGIRPGAVHQRPRRQLAEELWRFMEAKREYLSGSADASYYHRLLALSEELESTLLSHKIDSRSLEALHFFPYASFTQSRRQNFAALTAQLESCGRIRIVNAKDIDVATHLVLETPNSDLVRARLARLKIYCPVHWPRPPGLPSEVQWKSDHFSVPVDHRYDLEDMLHVGTSIKEVLA